MENKKVLFLAIALLVSFVFGMIALIGPCWAAFSLSVTPYEGGYDLRFGRLNTQDAKVVKEVTITIITDIGKQYRVYQRLDKPLTTPDGVEIDRNQFKMYTLINSNSQGTLERIEEFPVMSADTVLYTSNTTGGSDTFKIVYTLEPSASQVEGSYYGRMMYILMPIESTHDEVTDTLQMYADLTNEGAVEVSTGSGFKSIRITSSDVEDKNTDRDSVFINIKGNLGARYRLYQQLSDSVMKSATGEEFDLEKVKFEITDTKKRAIIKQGNLSELVARSLIYTSDDLGSSNQIVIAYKPAEDFPKHKAGFYQGAINYYLETAQAKSDTEGDFIDSVDMELEVEPIFKITAASVSQQGNATEQEGGVFLQFGEVSYKTDAKESYVKIKVNSNLQKPYLVTQKLSAPLQNEEGSIIPQELFTFSLKKAEDTGAKLKVNQEPVVEVDKDIPLFVSNTKGDSDEFEIIYRLKTTPDTRGGNYKTGLSYSLSEL